MDRRIAGATYTAGMSQDEVDTFECLNAVVTLVAGETDVVEEFEDEISALIEGIICKYGDDSDILWVRWERFANW